MLKMSVKKSDAPPAEGSASAVREAARSSGRERSTSPERPKRRSFTAEYKLRVLRDADAAAASGVEGAIGELLRREGLYSSHLTEWRRQRERGEVAGLAAKQRGPKPRRNPLADEVARLQRENERMKQELAKANTVIDVQRKVAALLGETLPEPTEEELVLGRGRFRTGRLDIKSGRRS